MLLGLAVMSADLEEVVMSVYCLCVAGFGGDEC